MHTVSENSRSTTIQPDDYGFLSIFNAIVLINIFLYNAMQCKGFHTYMYTFDVVLFFGGTATTLLRGGDISNV